MGWKATGQPTVRQQRDKWVVRVDGIDTETGKHRPRQLGTYPSKRSAMAASRAPAAEDMAAVKDTVGWLVRRYVASRTDISLKAREQYEWAIPHIEVGLGAIRLDRLDRSDVTTWIEDLAAGGRLSWRSVQICRTVLRAALSDAVAEGLIRRSPAVRAPMPRTVAKAPAVKETEAWSSDEIDRFIHEISDHRFAVPLRMGVLYGLRRSEAAALRWADLDIEAGTLRIDKGLIAVSKGAVWSEAKNERSRRRIPLDDATLRAFARRERQQAEEVSQRARSGRTKASSRRLARATPCCHAASIEPWR